MGGNPQHYRVGCCEAGWVLRGNGGLLLDLVFVVVTVFFNLVLVLKVSL